MQLIIFWADVCLRCTINSRVPDAPPLSEGRGIAPAAEELQIRSGPLQLSCVRAGTLMCHCIACRTVLSGRTHRRAEGCAGETVRV